MGKKILVINPGSTSTKVAIYTGDMSIYERTFKHSAESIGRYARIVDQLPLRKELILSFFEETDLALECLDCVVARGGLLKPLKGGTYLINEKMCTELRNATREHASNLGALIAKEIADSIGVPAFIVDPIVVDELEPVARISGLQGIERISIFHALNQKATARKAVKELEKKYEESNLIVAHLGGGISVGAHHNGSVIDVNNALGGDGPFSPERTGDLPSGSLVEMCFSNELSKEEILKKLIGNGGLVSYLGTNDAQTVEKMLKSGDGEAQLIYEAMAYQIAKEIGSCAAVLKGKVDAIIITGGIAHSKMMIAWLKERVEFIAPVMVFPGEGEMEALAAGAARVLNDEETAKSY